jgi:hypothetical protein
MARGFAYAEGASREIDSCGPHLDDSVSLAPSEVLPRATRTAPIRGFRIPPD